VVNHQPGITAIRLQVREESRIFFWQSAGTYYLNMVISEKKFPQHLATLEQFFSQKILCMSYTGFFWVPIWCFFFWLPSGESSAPKNKCWSNWFKIGNGERPNLRFAFLDK
jgi:hypothetical protein